MQTNEGPASLVELLAQEEELQFERFSNEDALAIGLQLVAAVRALGKSASVSIARGGQQLFQHAMTGTTPDHGDWIRRKENVVQRFGHSSYYVGMRHRIEGTRFEEQPGIDPAQYAAHGGCFPILLRGTGPIGTVTVSGLPQADDHAVVVGVLRAYLQGATPA
jgi:uncharacterized protein (UPF0303 family)